MISLPRAILKPNMLDNMTSLRGRCKKVKICFILATPPLCNIGEKKAKHVEL